MLVFPRPFRLPHFLEAAEGHARDLAKDSRSDISSGFKAALAGRPARRRVPCSCALVPFACPTSWRQRRDMRETCWKTREVTAATASRRRLRVDRPEGVCDACAPLSLLLARLIGARLSAADQTKTHLPIRDMHERCWRPREVLRAPLLPTEVWTSALGGGSI